MLDPVESLENFRYRFTSLSRSAVFLEANSLYPDENPVAASHFVERVGPAHDRANRRLLRNGEKMATNT